MRDRRPPASATDSGWLARLAHRIKRYRWIVIGAWIALTLLGGVAAGQLSSRWFQSTSVPGRPAYETGQQVLKVFGQACVRRTLSSSTPPAVTSRRFLRSAPRWRG